LRGGGRIKSTRKREGGAGKRSTKKQRHSEGAPTRKKKKRTRNRSAIQVKKRRLKTNQPDREKIQKNALAPCSIELRGGRLSCDGTNMRVNKKPASPNPKGKKLESS